MKLKETLNLGKTNFAMRANLPVKEVSLQEEWKEADIYSKIQLKNEGKPSYILHDGPPYANGKVHMGHALNKVTKDFIVRYKSMNGFILEDERCVRQGLQRNGTGEMQLYHIRRILTVA